MYGLATPVPPTVRSLALSVSARPGVNGNPGRFAGVMIGGVNGIGPMPSITGTKLALTRLAKTLNSTPSGLDARMLSATAFDPGSMMTRPYVAYESAKSVGFVVG